MELLPLLLWAAGALLRQWNMDGLTKSMLALCGFSLLAPQGEKRLRRLGGKFLALARPAGCANRMCEQKGYGPGG